MNTLPEKLKKILQVCRDNGVGRDNGVAQAKLLFGIIYCDKLQGMSDEDLNAIANEAGLIGKKTTKGTFHAEIKKGMKLAKYVDIKEEMYKKLS